MIGQTISQYKILEKLGEGGMGVVYKAQDTKLDRFVALKFLPPHLAASDQDKARFVQEAKSAAALNHPNVCSIIDIQDHEQPQGGKQMFIVMEFVDGHTLQEKKSSLTLKQSIDYGIQIAEGLAAAHEKGIIHRDIKPENIMIRKDGIAQIMDFGLAKLAGVSRLTKAGSTVGTLGYMSPEQVQGQETDHRSDIFSFGVLLYEMITSQSPFTGAHESAILYEIVNVDVAPPSSVKPELDPELDRIVLDCLEKDPNERMQSIKQVAIDLNRFKRTSSRTRMSKSFASRPAMTVDNNTVGRNTVSQTAKKYIPWGIVAILTISLALILMLQPTFEAPIKSSLSASIVLPDSLRPLFFGGGSPPLISPDGRHIAMIEARSRQIVVYSLETQQVNRLQRTEGSNHPFWSPDGKYIGFFNDNRIKKIDLSGGAPMTICLARHARGGSWNQFDQIIFTEDYQTPLMVVSANGGTPEQITVLDSTRKEGSHRFPFFLPDGKHFLYLVRTISVTGEAEGDAIYAGSLDGSVKKMIVRSSTNAMYANGHIIFLQNRTIMAQRFDPDQLSLSGEPFILEQGVINDFSWNLAMYSVSNNGILLSQSGQLSSGAPILIYSMEGKIIQSIGGMEEQNEPRFSPDGTKLAVWFYDIKARKTNLWIYDLRTGGKTRLTNGVDGEFSPLWSPDGSTIVYWSDMKKGKVYETSVLRSSESKLFFPSDDFLRTEDWSRDGKKMFFTKVNPSLNNQDIGWIDTEKKDKLHLMINSQFDEIEPRTSPDNKWLAYGSNESGEYEIYVTSLNSQNSQAWKLTDDARSAARWGSTASELYYINIDQFLVRTILSFSPNGITNVSKKILFKVPLTTMNFDVSRNGKNITFIRAFEADLSTYPPISMKLFWQNVKKE